LLCLSAQKAILCEKPFAINAEQAREVIALARKNGLFAMEAMWSRFIPLYPRVRELLSSGAIGDVKTMTADFGLQMAFNEKSRLFDPALGGGALLDLGVYPISLAYYLLGRPSTVISRASIGRSGVDEQSFVVFHYEDGRMAALHSSFLADTPGEVTLSGSRGTLRVHGPIYRPNRYTLTRSDVGAGSFSFPRLPWLTSVQHNPLVEKGYRRLSRLIRSAGGTVVPYEGNGYQYEAQEAMRCLDNGQTESPVMPLEETWRILDTMDTIRSQWNLQYPDQRAT